MDKILSLDDIKKWRLVALDTNVITEFHKPKYNQIANDLRRASKGRFRFVIPDICLCEAIDYLEATPPILPDEWANMARNLKKFVWREFPILPSRKELYAILGVTERKDFRPQFTSTYAKGLFDFFCKYPCVKDHEVERRREMQAELERARRQWRALIADVRREFLEKKDDNPQWKEKIVVRKLFEYYGTDLDATFIGNVPLSERRALALEYVVSLATLTDRQGAFSYDQDSDDNRNDGIDYLIMDVIMLGVAICSNDHFIKRVRSSHRKDNKLAEQQLHLCLTFEDLLELVEQRKD